MKKIPTLFHREFENRKIVGITSEITEGCEEAFLNGTPTIKYNGSCCAIINREFYKRYDVKKGKPIPDGAIKCQDEADPITGHLPCWVRVDENNPSDKWFVEAYNKAYIDYLYATDGRILPNGTYEAIGVHFQGNPYHLTYDTLIPHGKDVVMLINRTFEGVKEWLENNAHEGLVFWLNGKPICKIKRTDFDLKWPTEGAKYYEG